jgi:hypothetical protein
MASAIDTTPDFLRIFEEIAAQEICGKLGIWYDWKITFLVRFF